MKKEYLEECLNSITNQILENIEIILILDGCNKEIEKYVLNTKNKILDFEKAKNISHYNIYGYHHKINEGSITPNYDKNIVNDINIFLSNVDGYIKNLIKMKDLKIHIILLF